MSSNSVDTWQNHFYNSKYLEYFQIDYFLWPSLRDLIILEFVNAVLWGLRKFLSSILFIILSVVLNVKIPLFQRILGKVLENYF